MWVASIDQVIMDLRTAAAPLAAAHGHSTAAAETTREMQELMLAVGVVGTAERLAEVSETIERLLATLGAAAGSVEQALAAAHLVRGDPEAGGRSGHAGVEPAASPGQTAPRPSHGSDPCRGGGTGQGRGTDPDDPTGNGGSEPAGAGGPQPATADDDRAGQRGEYPQDRRMDSADQRHGRPGKTVGGGTQPSGMPPPTPPTPVHGRRLSRDEIAALQQDLPAPVEVRSGAKTHGRYVDPTTGEVQTPTSGADAGSARVDEYLRGEGMPVLPQRTTDVEMKTAMMMRDRGITHLDLVINHRPCPGLTGCDGMVPVILPEGTTMTVHGRTRDRKSVV